MAEPALSEDTTPQPPRAVVRSRWFWIGAAVVTAGMAAQLGLRFTGPSVSRR
jgi:hypothetical protein